MIYNYRAITHVDIKVPVLYIVVIIRELNACFRDISLGNLYILYCSQRLAQLDLFVDYPGI